MHYAVRNDSILISGSLGSYPEHGGGVWGAPTVVSRWRNDAVNMKY